MLQTAGVATSSVASSNVGLPAHEVDRCRTLVLDAEGPFLAGQSPDVAAQEHATLTALLTQNRFDGRPLRLDWSWAALRTMTTERLARKPPLWQWRHTAPQVGNNAEALNLWTIITGHEPLIVERERFNYLFELRHQGELIKKTGELGYSRRLPVTREQSSERTSPTPFHSTTVPCRIYSGRQ